MKRARERRFAVALLAAAGALLTHTSCLLPVRYAPAVEGVVIDAETGRPVHGVLVVVRFDAYYHDVLPDRELLGHREGRTDAHGRFRVGPITRPGITAWPLLRTEARVVAALAEGYRCAAPQPLRGETTISLDPARDMQDRRDSCRPIPARAGEAGAYMSAWRALFPDERVREERAREERLEQLLAARTAFGFGENCDGPVLDLALAPDGERAAFVVAAGPAGAEIRGVTLDGGPARPAPLSRTRPSPHQRLAWTSPSELVLWEPAPEARRAISASIFATERFEVVWRHAPGRPAAASVDARYSGPSRPLDPEDLNDEADARWLGRSFALRREVHPRTGLSLDRLDVTGPDGTRQVFELPGEACGPSGRFGRPHYRIAADGRTGLDLRFVEGGCHAVRIDLETGAWTRLDRSDAAAVCQHQRSVPGSHLAVALRGYARDVTEVLERAGADPALAYVLHIDETGRTRVETRDFAGERHTVSVPPFPLSTPLQRIDVSLAGRSSEADEDRPASPDIEPL